MVISSAVVLLRPLTAPLTGFAELLAQLPLRPLQHLLARRRQALAGPIDVEGEHRHRRTIGIRLAPLAAFGRALERSSDAFRTAQFKDALFQIECVALLGDSARPSLGFAAQLFECSASLVTVAHNCVPRMRRNRCKADRCWPYSAGWGLWTGRTGRRHPGNRC